MGETEKQLLTKKDLRLRGLTHRQIKELPTSGKVVKSGGRGRPSFAYNLADVVGVGGQAQA